MNLLSDNAYKKIKKLILEKRVLPGEGLSENALASELGMSRTPIRQSLQKLTDEGFIKALPNKGVVVNAPTVREIREIFQMRICLETFAAQNIIRLLDDNDLKMLSEIRKKQESFFKTGELNFYLEHDYKFHYYFILKLNNSLVEKTFNNMYDLIIYFGADLKKFGNRERANLEHAEMFNCAVRKDIIAFVEIVEEHLYNSMNILLKGYSNI